MASAGNNYASNGDFAYFPASYGTILAVGRQKATALGEDVTIAALSGNTRREKGTSCSAVK